MRQRPRQQLYFELRGATFKELTYANFASLEDGYYTHCSLEWKPTATKEQVDEVALPAHKSQEPYTI
jgi:hypothetical protein